jgi:FkbM family methyltransferase
MNETISNAAWGLGIRLRNRAKHAGLLGRLEPALLKLAPRIIRPPSEEMEIALAWAMRMTVPAGFPSARSYAAGLYEQEVTAAFRELVRPGMTVVDVGANIGYYTLLASHLVGAQGRVYAFEPDARNFAYLERNIRANECTNVTAVNAAAAKSCGTATFVVDAQGAEGWLAPDGSSQSATAVVVETTSLDAYFSQVEGVRIDVIKMDIEGAEQSALEGATEMSQRSPALKIITEYNAAAMRRAGGSAQGLAAAMLALGFREARIIEQAMRPIRISDGLPSTEATYDLLLSK